MQLKQRGRISGILQSTSYSFTLSMTLLVVSPAGNCFRRGC